MRFLFVLFLANALAGITPITAYSTSAPFEIVVLQKSSNQIQFAFCINLPVGDYTGKGFQIEYRLYEGVKTQPPGLAEWEIDSDELQLGPSNSTYRPPRDQAVDTDGLVFRYRGNQNPTSRLSFTSGCPYYTYWSTGVMNTGSSSMSDGTYELADGTVVSDFSQISQIRSGTTYTIEASIYMHDGNIGTTYRPSLVATTDSGCPVAAPSEPEVDESDYSLMARIDDTNRVVEVLDRKSAEASKNARPDETWVPTFASHPTKRLATTGLYYNGSLKDFGPLLEAPNSLTREQVFGAARLDWSTCATADADFVLTIDPSTSVNCRVIDNSVYTGREGPCLVEVRAVAKAYVTDLSLSNSDSPTKVRILKPVLQTLNVGVPSLTRRALMLLRPTGGGSDGDHGDGGDDNNGRPLFDDYRLPNGIFLPDTH